ncbi:MAG: ATP-binding protein [Pseudomonadota bacterium]
MARLVLVCGPTGAGKTTYAISLANEIGAVRFSIDQWMQTLYSKDMTSLDFAWISERLERCYEQIWNLCQQILELDGNVILDLGFTTGEQRAYFVSKGEMLSFDAEIHFLDADVNTRRQRVKQRNTDKDPELYSFEVTDMMFDFIEPRFEAPSAEELKKGCTIAT